MAYSYLLKDDVTSRNVNFAVHVLDDYKQLRGYAHIAGCASSSPRRLSRHRHVVNRKLTNDLQRRPLKELLAVTTERLYAVITLRPSRFHYLQENKVFSLIRNSLHDNVYK